MAQVRQIRLLIPPFFLAASLLLGAVSDGIDLPKMLAPVDPKVILTMLAIFGIGVLPLGFFLSAMSILFLRLWAKRKGWETYEVHFKDPKTLGRIWTQLNIHESCPQDSTLILYATATFDHEVLNKGIHEWLLRRWSSFNVSAHSCTALVFSMLVALLWFPPWHWWVAVVIMIVILFSSAIVARRETMAMLDFQSHRSHVAGDSEDEKPTPPGSADGTPQPGRGVRISN